MKSMTRLALATAVLLAAGVASAADPNKPAPPEPAHAKAELKDAKGRAAGSVKLTETSDGVKLAITATGLDAGKHGIHVHEVGKCDPPDFKSAGAHFNPHAKKHGSQNSAGPHAGDLPNLVASADGMASGDMTVKGVTLGKGEKDTLMDADGSAIVIHAKADDEKTDPSGNSGDRVVCGIVTAP
jgi:superoxide dismutase, Cu-Zn family